MANIKTFLLIILFFAQISVYAEVVKLTCNISTESRFSEGVIRRENFVAAVDVNDDGIHRDIQISTHKILAFVSTNKVATTIRIIDRSDSSRWNITNIDYDPEKTQRTNTQISIDRNSGVISFEEKFEDTTGYINTKGNGNCLKIDQNIRKF